MKKQIAFTKDGVISYPLHSHDFWEIMYYTEGHGYLHTPDCDYPYEVGTAIIVPPNILHGSVSETGFKNISIGGRFEHLFSFTKPQTLKDNESNDCLTLAMLIFRNRFGNEEYLSSLFNTYGYLLLQSMNFETPVSSSVNCIVNEIAKNAFDPEIHLNELLNSCGYAEDYIRMHFKKIVGKTPTEFLTKIRIDHAVFLLNIYGNRLPLTEIAAKCGYADYAYFSKKFKSVMGMSPKKYIQSGTA